MAGVKPLLETIGALLPKGIKAWHASPHDFDKVDLSKIGTGQGAQSYGPGFYAAESPAVSGVGGEYWKEFAGKMQRDFYQPHEGGKQLALEYLMNHGGDRKAAIETLKIDTVGEKSGRYLDALTILEEGKQVGPRVYELNIKADPKSFLQWDEPLKNQMQHVEKVPHLLDLAKEEAHSRVLSSSNQSRRNQLYDMISHPTEATGEFAFRSGAPDKTMGMLRDAGIPGIRYADAASRGPGVAKSYYDALKRAQVSGNAEDIALAQSRIKREMENAPRTYNYVINNPDIIEIMRKLAIPGMVTGGAASVYQPQGQQ